MMLPKTYRDPGSETLATFVLASLSGTLAVGAVGAPHLSLLLYPAYFALVNGAMAIFIHHRRRVLDGAAGSGVAQAVSLAAPRCYAGRFKPDPYADGTADSVRSL